MHIIEKNMEIDKVDLTEADIVVSGGRGMRGTDYTVIENLAEALGGAVRASRAAVDEGWRPHAHQVGQTPAKWCHPCCISPVVFPERSSIWPVCHPQKSSLPSTKTRMHLFS
jgi:hypothetical protein